MRNSTKRRRPIMTLQRWIFVITACILVLITSFSFYYREIQKTTWSSTNDAEAKAVEAANLKSVETIYTHIWDKKSWIVEGNNQEDNKVFVWISEDKEPETILASDGKSKQEIKEAFYSSKGDAVIKRIQPGVLDGQRVWEVFYSIGNNPELYYYDFYTFDSGSLVNSYRLPAKTEP